MNMKSKSLKSLIIVIMLMTLLCACGAKTFVCPLCMKAVKQAPHKVTVFGQQVDVCNTCYKQLVG